MAALREPTWSGRIESLSQIGLELRDLRESHPEDQLDLRTSVLTHIAWVPAEWERVALDVLAGLEQRHPSRAIVLLPDPEADEDAIDAELTIRSFTLGHAARNTYSEVITLRLRGARADAPASVVAPLLIPDLPVFLRWRGRPAFGASYFERLADLVDRVVVDSSEWPDVPAAYGELKQLFEHTVVSDIAWRRGLPYRWELAHLWPEIADVRELTVVGPRPDAVLLAGWLGSRLGRKIELVHVPADLLESVAVDGRPVPEPRRPRPSGSDLLSDELEQFSRDPVYEAAVLAAA
jgi:Glucose-6-phosphate dehydrogenase subunit N-terminal domain